MQEAPASFFIAVNATIRNAEVVACHGVAENEDRRTQRKFKSRGKQQFP